ncbi:MAG: XRE family transcriptional regulator [Clostridiales bacterium]|nr:XRE family transcriptional regulator [Clostridiales bacterium]
MRKRTRISRQGVLRQMMELAEGPVNDAVKLAYLNGEGLEEIEGLDLTALAEFKRSGNGAVEIKLTDRLAVLEKVLAHLEDESNGAAAFLDALEAGTGEKAQ